VEAVGIEKCPELVIGKGLDGEEKANKKEFRERVFEFLINL
ncbi:15683_t:CDS:1, partial [Acaulospora morrowiae]